MWVLVSLVFQFASTSACEVHSGFDFSRNANDLSQAITLSHAGECCDLCTNTTRCKAFVWNRVLNTCYLKHSLGYPELYSSGSLGTQGDWLKVKKGFLSSIAVLPSNQICQKRNITQNVPETEGLTPYRNESSPHSKIVPTTALPPSSTEPIPHPDHPNNTNTTGNGETTETPHVSHVLIFLAPILFVLLGIIVGFGYYICRRRRLHNLNPITARETRQVILGTENEFVKTEETAYNFPYDGHYELSKDQIIIDPNLVLGQGEFGIVYKGEVTRNGKSEPVAVKTTKSSTKEEHAKSILNEIKLMIFIGHHPNIIRLVGAYTEEMSKGVIYMAMEFCENGSLESVLRRSSFHPNNETYSTGLGTETSGELYLNTDASRKYVSARKCEERMTRNRMNEFAAQIAGGMKYLESKKVIHADLATRNILVAKDGRIRLTDFGLSRRLYKYTNYVKKNQEPLPWKWMAPESLLFAHFSAKSDVWALGVTLWEIYSLGNIPYAGLSWHVSFAKRLEEGLRLDAPKYATDEVYKKMLKCWELDPKLRPSFAEIEDFFLNTKHTS